MKPYLRELRFTKWVFNAVARPDGRIQLQEGWVDPVRSEIDMSSILDRMIDTKEKCIHDALVKLGWTPPKETHGNNKSG